MTDTGFPGAAIGYTLPTLQMGPVSRTMLALFAGASGDHNPVHIDSDFAHQAGLPDVFAHGMLPFGGMAQIVTRWAGIGRLRELSTRFVAITQVNDVIIFGATVIEHFEVAGTRCARLRLTATAQDGRQTLSGEAVVALD